MFSLLIKLPETNVVKTNTDAIRGFGGIRTIWNMLLKKWCFVLQHWCWRHPRGSDLLRMASFQNNIYHEKDDIRCVRTRCVLR